MAHETTRARSGLGDALQFPISATLPRALGETVRQRVNDKAGIDLEWEIKRIGVPVAA